MLSAPKPMPHDSPSSQRIAQHGCQCQPIAFTVRFAGTWLFAPRTTPGAAMKRIGTLGCKPNCKAAGDSALAMLCCCKAPSGLGQYELGLSLAGAWLCHAPTEQRAHAVFARVAMALLCGPMQTWCVLMPEVDMIELAMAVAGKISQGHRGQKAQTQSKKFACGSHARSCSHSAKPPALGRAAKWCLSIRPSA